jgi:hypothetical protein
LSTQDLLFDEMDPPYQVIKDERLDLLPEPGTVRSSHISTRDMIRSKSSEALGITATIGFARANFAVFLYSSLLSRFLDSSAAVMTAYASAISSFPAKIVQEQQKYECNRMKALTQCLPLFRTTMKATRPFLPRQGVVIHPEVRVHMENDEYLRKIIDVSVIELSNALEDEDSYLLEVFEENDAEVPRWIENIIRVRIGNVKFENKIELWENLEERVRSKIEEIRKQLPPNKRRKIDALNESLSIRLEEETF